MLDDRQQELISAYLDGELPASEAAEVEQLLAASDEARNLADELRAISKTIRQLPAQRSPQALGATVLKSIDARRSTVAQATEIRSSRWRSTSWAALAIAGAIVVMVLSNGPIQEQAETPVALVPEEARRASQPPTTDRKARELAAARSSERGHRPELATLPDASAPKFAGRSARDEPLMTKEAADNRRHSKLGPVAGQGGVKRSRVVESVKTPNSRRTVADALAPEADADERSSSFTEGESKQRPSPEEELPAIARQLAGEIQTDENTMIVWVDATRTAAQNDVLRQVLVRQNIAWQEESGPTDLDGKPQPQRRKATLGGKFQDNRIVLGLEGKDDRLANPDSAPLPVVEASNKYVWVEASLAQVNGAIDDLSQQSGIAVQSELAAVGDGRSRIDGDQTVGQKLFVKEKENKPASTKQTLDIVTEQKPQKKDRTVLPGGQARSYHYDAQGDLNLIYQRAQQILVQNINVKNEADRRQENPSATSASQPLPEEPRVTTGQDVLQSKIVQRESSADRLSESGQLDADKAPQSGQTRPPVRALFVLRVLEPAPPGQAASPSSSNQP